MLTTLNVTVERAKPAKGEDGKPLPPTVPKFRISARSLADSLTLPEGEAGAKRKVTGSLPPLSVVSQSTVFL